MKIKTIFLLLILSLSLVPFVKADSTQWYDSSYLYRNIYEIDSSLVDEELTDFPVLVYLNSSYVNWSRVNNDLSDILFTDSDNNLLSHELDSYTLNNESWIWVKIPVVSSVLDTKFFLYYGFSGAESVENKSDVWSNGFVGVWHMNDNDTLTILDSTSNDNDGVKFGVNDPLEVEGIINKGQQFDGIETGIDFGDVCDIDVSDTVFESFVKIGALNVYANIFSKGWVDGVIGVGNEGIIIRRKNDNRIQVQIQDSDEDWSIHSNDTFSENDLVYVAVVVDRTVENKVFMYINGVRQTSEKSLATFGSFDNAKDLRIGCYSGAYDYIPYNSIIDESKISIGTTRSSAWVGASYETQRLNLISLINTETFNEDYLAFGVIAIIISLTCFFLVITKKDSLRGK